MKAYIGLEAKCPKNQIFRYYNIYISMDMFEEWIIIINHGKLGFRGKVIRYSYNEYSQMCHKLLSILRKRRSATKRIGCDYTLHYLNASAHSDIISMANSFWPLP